MTNSINLSIVMVRMIHCRKLSLFEDGFSLFINPKGRIPQAYPWMNGVLDMDNSLEGATIS